MCINGIIQPRIWKRIFKNMYKWNFYELLQRKTKGFQGAIYSAQNLEKKLCKIKSF